MTNSDTTRTAYHEAGHFVVAYALSNYGEDYGVLHKEITIKPDGESFGQVIYESNKFAADPKLIRDEAISMYAGYYAEVRYDPAYADTAKKHADRDFEKAKKLLTSLDDVEDLSLSIENSRAEAKALVDQHWNEIELLANALLRRETIPGDEAEIIIDVARGETTLEQLAQSPIPQIQELATSLLGADE